MKRQDQRTARGQAVKLLLLTLALFAPQAAGAGGRVAAQALPEPRREQLLNGFRVLIVNRPGDAEVVLRLRVHSGAAFDLAGKEGTMALLGDALFSDPATREYVTEELGGRLEVATGYDSINVTLAGRAADFERLVELLRGAFVNTQLTPEVVGRLREARIKTVRELGAAPETIADRAVAARLFGTFPYGRPAAGAPDTLARVERADLLLSRERFLSPNNTTLVLIGGVEPSRVMRALRQYLGVWRKSDRTVPATFRQPDAPDERALVIDLPGAPDAQVRLAVRGLARSDRDSAAALVLAQLARERWLKAVPGLKDKPAHFRHDAYAAGGVFTASAPAGTAAAAAQTLEAARAVLQALATTQASETELELARRTAAATLADGLKRPEGVADAWLDEHTYGGQSVNETIRAVNSLSAAEVQRVAARLFLHTPAAVAAVGDAAQLRTSLARLGAVEVAGEAAPAPPARARPEPSATPGPLKRP